MVPQVPRSGSHGAIGEQAVEKQFARGASVVVATERMAMAGGHASDA